MSFCSQRLNCLKVSSFQCNIFGTLSFHNTISEIVFHSAYFEKVTQQTGKVNGKVPKQAVKVSKHVLAVKWQTTKLFPAFTCTVPMVC